MQFDFNLNPNASQQIEVKGKFFKYKNGLGSIRVRENGGDFIDLQPGQGVWNRNYASLSVQDISGAANNGILIAGDFDFRDDTIIGTVDVLDGGKKRTSSNVAFSCYGRSNASGGLYSCVQLYNDASSVKKIIVESLDIQCQTASELVGIGITKNNIILTTQGVAGYSKLSSGVDSQSARIYTQPLSQPGDTAIIKNALSVIGIIQYQTTAKKFIEPVVLMPGYGLAVWSGSINCDLYVTYEFFEE